MRVIKWPRLDSDGSCVNKNVRGNNGSYSNFIPFYNSIWNCTEYRFVLYPVQVQVLCNVSSTGTDPYSPWYIVHKCNDSVDEAGYTNNRGWDQHACVEAKPCKVYANLFSKIFPARKIDNHRNQ